MKLKKPRLALNPMISKAHHGFPSALLTRNMSKEEELMQNRKINTMKTGMEMIHNDLVIVSKKLDKLLKCLCELDNKRHEK